MDQQAKLCHRCGYRPRTPGESCCPIDGLRLVGVAEHERSPRDPFLGSVLGGKYPILGILGAGGMGNVYLSHHPSLGMELAVKVIRPEVLLRDPKAGARFRREARAMARLSSHPGVATLFDFGAESDQTLFMVMERVVGENLHQVFRRGGMTANQLIHVVLDVLDVLCVAHSRGVLHRDLKPGNIVLLSDPARYGRQHRVKVLDFGLAKLHGDPALGAISLQGIAQGTPTYMAPEQFRGEPVDHRADLYALATILYEGLAGRPPYMLLHPEEPSDILLLGQMKVHQAPEPLPALPHLPPALARLILCGMERHPEQRFASADQMARALAAVDLGAAGDASLPASIAAVGGEPAEPESLDDDDLEQVLREISSAEEIALASGDLLPLEGGEGDRTEDDGRLPAGHVIHPTPRPGLWSWLRSLDPEDPAWTRAPLGGDCAAEAVEDDEDSPGSHAPDDSPARGWTMQAAAAPASPEAEDGEQPHRSGGRSWGAVLWLGLVALLLWAWKDPGAGPATDVVPVSATIVPSPALPGGGSVDASPVGRSASAAAEAVSESVRRAQPVEGRTDQEPAAGRGCCAGAGAPVAGEGAAGAAQVVAPVPSVAGAVGASRDSTPCSSTASSAGGGSSFCRSPEPPTSDPPR